MDLAFDNFFSSNSSENDITKHKSFGFGFLKQDRGVNEDDYLRAFKRSNAGGGQQMLSFSSPSNALSWGAGRGGGMQQGVKGPFTPSQWMELEHQALIYKYITANVPIPSYLLNPITRAFESAGFPSLRSTALGWGGFQVGFGNSDPEPGRCRRTDGKKWRCSRDAVGDQKYCERHINRGRHRSRKPVEPIPAPAPAPTATSGAPSLHLQTTQNNSPLSRISTLNRTEVNKERGDGGAYDHAPLISTEQSRQNAYQQEFGLVCSSSLLNPTLRHFMDDGGPKTHLSISIPTATELEMGLGLGPSWVMGGGGPLGEVVAGECKPLDSPTGVLQRVSLSNSSAASSPRADTFLFNPTLPAL